MFRKGIFQINSAIFYQWFFALKASQEEMDLWYVSDQMCHEKFRSVALRGKKSNKSVMKTPFKGRSKNY